ncbi:MAG: amidohydrolase family protein, partial [Rhodothermales bacterium]
MSLLLRHVHWRAAGREGYADIRISRGRIRTIGPGLVPARDEQVLELEGYVALPGLINAHDHLGLNLFPRSGHPPYSNFYAWAGDIYRPRDEMQTEIMSVSLRDRLHWGAYRNLISGVTTVAHHDPYVRRIFNRRFPVHVLRFGWAHSLGFDPHIRSRALAARLRRRMFVVHAAEGTDAGAAGEIELLREMRLLRSNTILIHAVALESRHIELIVEGRCSVVWCPTSNEYLYEASPPISELRRRGVPVALGTDSTLSGSATLLDEIRFVRKHGEIDDEELFGMVTTDAARIFRLRDGRGTLREGGLADIAVFSRGSCWAEDP